MTRATIIVLTIVAGVLAPMIAIDFVNDDIGIIRFALHGPRPDFTALLTRAEVIEVYYRPLFDLTLGLDFLAWGWTAAGYRLTNLLLHLVATVLVLALGRALRFEASAALCAALLFGLHPIHEMSLYWIAGRTDVLCSVFYLLTLLLFTDAFARGRPGGHALSLVAALLAMLSKEMAITLPAAVAIVAWWIGRDGNDTPHRRGALGTALLHAAPYAGIVAAVIVGRMILLDNNVFDDAGAHQSVPVLAIARNLATYAGLLVVPLGHEAIAGVLRASPVLWTAALIPFAIGAALLWRKRHSAGPLVLCFALVLVTLLPVSRLMMRWYLYLPSAFFALGLGWLISRYAERRRRAAVAIACSLALVYAATDVATIAQWISASRIASTLPAQLHAALGEIHAGDTLRFATIPAKIGSTPLHHLGFPAAVRHALGNDSIAIDVASKLVMSEFPPSLTIEMPPDRTDAVRLQLTSNARERSFGGYFLVADTERAGRVAEGRPPLIRGINVTSNAHDTHGRPVDITVEPVRSTMHVHWLVYDGRSFKRMPR